MTDPLFFTGLLAEATVCAYCGYCRAVCPTYAGVGWESCSPRGRLQLTKLLLEGAPLSAGHLTRLYQCTLCGHCTQVCSTRIDLRRYWLEARSQTAARDLAPPGLSAARDHVARTGNVYGFPNDERAGWVEYMDDAPPDLYLRERASVVYFVGCSSSFSPRVQRIAESFARLMTAAGVDFTLLGEGEVCCGFPLQAAGMDRQAEALIAQNVARVGATGASTVVFTCPACRLMWQEEYAPRLPGLQLLHSTELLARLSAAGRLPLRALERTVTYHDPCDLARNGGVYDPPRQLLAAIPGLRLVEVHERRERGLCCGGGGDLEMVDPALTQQVAARTASKLSATGAQAIITACPQCVRTLARGVEAARLIARAEAGAPGVEILDIVELLAQATDAKRGGSNG